MHLNHKSNCLFTTAKHSKKIVKRAANDESQTEKQDVFIVTPSKNLDSYLDIVRLANKAEASSEVESEATTDSTFVATISTNPFLAPNNEEATVAVVVKVDEVTTTSTEAAVTESAVSETTQSLTSVETTKASTTVAESSSIASEVQPTVKVLETTQASTETSQTSTESSTTQASTTNAQSSSSSSSSESEESDESKPKPSEEEEVRIR